MIDEKPGPTSSTVDERPAHRLPPIAYPLLALLFGGILVWSFSRVLLAVSKYEAVVIGTLMALNILVGAALVAYGRRVRRRPTSWPLLVTAGLAVVAAGIVAFTFGDVGPEGELPHDDGRAVSVALAASGSAFVQTELTFPAGSEVTIEFQNEDQGVQHNFVLFDGPDASAPELFSGEIITGTASTEYTFRAPPPGTYFFYCAVHPTTMTGTAIAEEGGGPIPGGPGAPPEVRARGTAFMPTDLSLPGGGNVTIHFVNEDAVQHNVAIFEGQDPTGELVFRGDLIAGPAEIDYTFEAPPPGTYFFHCDVHPADMRGTITFG
ncbi:MAG: cupredoxin domain-containing protein [Actinomycetota bacterium]